MKRILFATDGAPESASALAAFSEHLRADANQVSVLSVVPLSRWPEGHPEAARYYQEAGDAAEAAVGKAVELLDKRGFAAEGRVRFGDPAEVIVEAARDLEVDLLVLATHHRHGVERLLKGSVASRVLCHAPCGVVLYPYSVLHETAPTPASQPVMAP